MARNHLAILKTPYLQAILDGRKTIESRFTKTRREPFGRVSVGDSVFLKLSSGPVCALATVSAVRSFENLTPRQIIALKRRYNGQIRGSEEYWYNKKDCRFGVLLWLKDVKPIEPVRIRKNDWRAWVVLTQQENYGLLKNRAVH